MRLNNNHKEGNHEWWSCKEFKKKDRLSDASAVLPLCVGACVTLKKPHVWDFHESLSETFSLSRIWYVLAPTSTLNQRATLKASASPTIYPLWCQRHTECLFLPQNNRLCLSILSKRWDGNLMQWKPPWHWQSQGHSSRCAWSSGCNRQFNEFLFWAAIRYQICSTFTVFTVAVIWIRRECRDSGPLLGSESDAAVS